MNRIQILKILEYTWLAVGVVTLIMAAYSLHTGDQNEAIMFLLFTLVAGFLFMLRRQQRRSAEKLENRKEN
jgi:heme/copper-type cytochrome/quinol oxidase subunit 3